MSEEKSDHLSLAAKPLVQKMLEKEGDRSEQVWFSDFVIKINKREKEQTRVLLITQKAVYNLMPSDYSKCKRRIALPDIASVTTSQVSDEFVIHCPDEYDYRFKSNKKLVIASLLKKLFLDHVTAQKAQGKTVIQERLAVSVLPQADLKDLALTKKRAKLLDRSQRLALRKKLIAQHASDDEENKEVAEHADEITDMLSENKGDCKLEDFELLKVLGRGSFGKVMQVRHKGDGEIYAMKILKKQAIIARNQVEHTRAERQILQQLQHPFLMTLRYAFQSKTKLYFVLDYYQGGELFFHLKQKRRFSESVARLYVAEIALALGHLHSLNVVYRDLKPENILLDTSGHCCLTDFGLSKDMDPDDKAHTFCGTPEYLAPEIVTGAGHEKAVDWWSLGILLYELTVGIPPFYSQNVNEMYSKIQHGVLRFPPFLSEDCKSIIVGLLHRDPTKRLGSGKDIDDVIGHPFFKSLDIEKLLKKEIEPEYKPINKGNADTSNFDETFTSEPVVDTLLPDSELSKTMQKEGDAFDGFTYVDKSGVLK